MSESGVYLKDLDSVEKVTDSAIIMIEDNGDTSTISIMNLRRSMIDDATTSFDKVFSSAKVIYEINVAKELANSIERTLTEKIISVENSTAKEEDFNAIIDEIRAIMITQEDWQNVQSALNGTRKKVDLIGSSDLDVSTDERKIHLRNLSEEVLSAITGTTPVSLVKYPTGGWTNEAIANLAINAKKLSANYRYRAYVTSGSMDEILQDGIYLVASNVEGLPSAYEGDKENKLLTVTIYGDNRDYIKQEVEYIGSNEYRPTFVRKGKVYNIHNVDFQAIYPINGEFKITSDLVGEDFSNRGVIEEGDLFEITKEGSYKVCKGVMNLPTDDEYFVSIYKYGDCIVYEAKLNSDTVGILYLAYSHTNSYGISTTTQWYKITNNNRSKFDDRTLHIYGDGCAYGLGVADTSKMYPQLLREKYGFKVFNHAITGATAGNYGSAARTEISVITQVESTYFNDDDIAIIMVGAEDFKAGNCPIGNDVDTKDTTFKGSLNQIISKIYKKNPSIKVLMLTPLFRGSLEAGDGRDSDYMTINGRKLTDYTKACIDVANVAHIPYADLMNTLGINKYNFEYYLSDGIYLSEKGQELLATRLFDILSGLF